MPRTSRRFTIVIPTRERCGVLEHALRTCTDQDHDRLTILVSDNDSTDQTRDVVEAARDSRVSYVNTRKRLGMSGNWEFALSHVEDGFVLFLGDDDGLLPGALSAFDALIDEHHATALAWKQAVYSWPDHPVRATQNLLTIPLQGPNLIGNRRPEVEQVVSRESLTALAQGRLGYGRLPGVYKGLVSLDLIRRATGPSGRFFQSQNPDVYAAIAIASNLDHYTFSQRPYTLNGASGYSTGSSAFAPAGGSDPVQTFKSEDNIPFHPSLDWIASMPILVAESFKQAEEHLPGGIRVNIDLRETLALAVASAARLPSRQYREVISALRTTAKRNELELVLENLVCRQEHSPVEPKKPVFGWNIARNYVAFDGSEMGLRNVHDAATFTGNFLALRQAGHSFSLSAVLRTTWLHFFRQLQTRLQANRPHTQRQDSGKP